MRVKHAIRFAKCIILDHCPVEIVGPFDSIAAAHDWHKRNAKDDWPDAECTTIASPQYIE